MKKVLCLAALAAVMGSTAAQAEGAYVSAGGGVNIPMHYGDPSLNTGFDFGVAAGFSMAPFRFEGAYSFLRNTGDLPSIFTTFHATSHLNLFMLNAYRDYSVSPLFTFSVGAGLGFGNMSFNVANDDVPGDDAPRSMSGLAYQLILGGSYSLNSTVSLGVNYHLVGFHPSNNGTGFHNLLNVNVSYKFQA